MILLVSSYCRYRPSCWGSWTYNLCMKLTVFDIRGVYIWWTSLSWDKCIVEWGSLDASWWFLQMTWYFILVSVGHLSRCVCFEQHFDLVNCLISCRNYMFFFGWGDWQTKDGSKWSLGGPGGDKASPNHGGWMIRGELLLGFQSNHLTSFDSSQRSLTQICWFNRKKVILLFVWKGGFLLDFEKSYSELKWKGRISNENVSSPQHWPSSKTSTTRVKIAVPQFFQDFDAGS